MSSEIHLHSLLTLGITWGARNPNLLLSFLFESCIDPQLLATTASQATDLIDEEDEKEGEEDFESRSARNSIEHSQSSLPSVECLNTPSTVQSSSTPSQASSLAIRKRAIERTTREAKSNSKRQRTEIANATVQNAASNRFFRRDGRTDYQEMKATRQLIAEKSPQEKASMELIKEFSHLDPAEQLVVLWAFETESTARLFLVMAGVTELR